MFVTISDYVKRLLNRGTHVFDGSRSRKILLSREGRRARLSRSIRFEPLEDRSMMSASGGVPLASLSPVGIAFASNATLDQNGDTAVSAAISNNEDDIYRFTPRVTGAYRIDAATPASNMDTVLGIYNSSGSRIAFNDDFSGLDSQVNITLNAGTTYYALVTNYANTLGGSYVFRVDGPASPTIPPPGASDDGYENNDTLSSASNLGTLTGTSRVNNLVMADGHDWYRFQMNGTGSSVSTVAISSSLTQGDLDLEVFDSQGRLVGRSNGATNNEIVSLNGQGPGTYFIHVLGYQGAATANYTLGVNTGSITPPPPTSRPFDIQIVSSGLTASQQAVFERAAQRWESIITGDLPNATYNGSIVDDLQIRASSRFIDGQGNILGQAGPDAFRTTGTRLPYHGIMDFDSADMAAMESSGQLFGVILHEMGHVLGIGTLWSSRGLVTGAGSSNPLYIGQRAVAEYRTLSGTLANGVPVENQFGPGSRDAHWRESVFGSELMTSLAGPGVNLPLSRMTIASLADLGYSVNLAAADSYRLSSNVSVSTTSIVSSNPWSMPASIGNLSPMIEAQAIVTTSRAGQSMPTQSSSAPTASRPFSSNSAQSWESAVDELFASWSDHFSRVGDSLT